MNIFRNVAGNAPIVNWYDNGWGMIAFSRGNRTFLAINNDIFDMDISLQTGLSAGYYCDVISGSKQGHTCTGSVVFVNIDGIAQLSITRTSENPMIAIHVDSKIY